MATNTPHYPALDLGPLPVQLVNAALGTELEPGNVRMSAAAHRHMAEDHPDDYAVCAASLSLAIAEPSFIGQAPEHTSNFEMVRRIRHPDGKAVLAEIGLERDCAGDYRVRSCYLIAAATVDERRRRRRLIAVLRP